MTITMPSVCHHQTHFQFNQVMSRQGPLLSPLPATLSLLIMPTKYKPTERPTTRGITS